MAHSLEYLKGQFPHPGKVEWIGVRSEKGADMQALRCVEAHANRGLTGDRTALSQGGRRQVTLFQAEYLAVVASLHPNNRLSYASFRRNIVISGLNLNILLNEQLCIGESVIEITGLCHPCSKMERDLGVGAYNALRGHGGLTAKIISSGTITLGADVEIVKMQSNLL